MDHARKLKYSLHLTNYCEGILVIFQPLSIFLVRSHQKLTMKIGFHNFPIRFGISMDFLNFWDFLELSKMPEKWKYEKSLRNTLCTQLNLFSLTDRWAMVLFT